MKKDLEATTSDLVSVCDDLDFALEDADAEKLDTKGGWAFIRDQLREVERQLRSAIPGFEAGPSQGETSELELRAHLAVMEARDRWGAIEPHLAPVWERLKEAGDKATDALIDAIAPVDDAELQKAIDSVVAEQSERREKAKEEAGEAVDKLREAAEMAVREVKEAFRLLRGRLPRIKTTSSAEDAAT